MNNGPDIADDWIPDANYWLCTSRRHFLMIDVRAITHAM